ncbi:MAG: heme-copper oxidase subunit III [Chloroflexi bacterium]|nr:heme-copper oxidase subunit III [Chloroflexota bacterium]
MTTRRSQAGVVTPAPGVTRPNVGLLGAAVFIVAESVFFMGLFLAYFYLRAESGTPWVRPDVSLIPPLANTAVLAASVVAITWAERGIARGDQGRLTVGVVIAAALGLVFMAVQSFEFASLAQLGFTPQIGAFGSTFFALLVFHVLRVFAGVIFMVIVLIRALLGQLSQRRRTVVQACALYWYFIATVWLVVFLVLYGG